MKVMITGSRDWKNRGPIEAMIKGMAGENVEFVFGDCPTGVDAIAWEYCKLNNIQHVRAIAKWDMLGKAAGPERNGRMIQHCLASKQSTVCFAFRTEGISNGTDDCVYQANVAGIPTYVMRKMPDLKETDYVVPGINFKRKARK